MKNKTALMLLLLCLCVAGCASSPSIFKVVDPADGTTVYGTYDQSRRVTIQMPSGELFIGDFASVNEPFRAGKGYAILTGNEGTVMEISYIFDRVTGAGAGYATTNTGRQYRVMF